ncbi:MAG: AmmeMemoRadiSam system protein B, partial [Deltaproteobacteria bacterium]
MERVTIRPKLRNIEVFPVEHEGQRLVCFRDPLALAEEVIFLPLPLLRIVRYFDGKKRLDEIQKLLSEEEAHEEVSLDFLSKFTEELDRFHFLESPRFEQHRRQIFSDYAARSTRPPFLSGKSYPADPVELTRMLEAYFLHEAGPKWPRKPRNRRIEGIIAPHIDFQRGGFCYAWAYREMIESLDPDLFVVLGTIHTGTSAPFTASRKGFETPFGTLEVDHPFLERLEAAYGHDLYAEEIAHRAEHSIEFQAVFLESIYNNPHSRFGKQPRPITFVPILCSILHEEIEAGRVPRLDAQVERFFQ